MQVSIQLRQKLAIGLLIITNLLFYQFGFDQKLTLANIYLKRDFLDWAAEHYYLLTVPVYLIATILSLLIFSNFTTNLVIGAGYFYGELPALIYSTLGFAIGYFLLYYILIAAFTPIIKSYFGENPNYKKLRKELRQYFWHYALAIRFLPIFPAMLVNIVCAIFSGNFNMFIYSSMIGSLPFLYILCGKGKYLADMDSITLLSADNFVSLSLLSLLSITPIIYKKLQRRARKKKKMVIAG